MGCAICHDGNSRALEFHDAHGEFHGWPESYALLPDKTSQANCFRCHAQEGGKLAGAEHFESGKSALVSPGGPGKEKKGENPARAPNPQPNPASDRTNPHQVAPPKQSNQTSTSKAAAEQ